MPGLFEVRVGTDLFYTDAEGNFLIQGHLIDTKLQRNLTEERIDKLLAIDFDALPLKDAFTIVRGNGKRKMAVFEDPNCGYCKRFERDLQKVDNVTIYMFLYPILGPDSTDKSRNIWCAKDKAKAWLDWMVRDQAGAGGQLRHRRAGAQRRIRQEAQDHRHAHAGLRRRHARARRHRRAAGREAAGRRHASDARRRHARASVHYRVEAADLHAHLFRVTLTIDQPAAPQRVSLPAWIPGSYLVREFSKNLQRLAARQEGRRGARCSSWTSATGRSSACPAARWCSATRSTPSTTRCAPPGWTRSAASSTAPACACGCTARKPAARAGAGARQAACAHWEAATGLAPHKVGKRGFGTYLAADYDELVDCPVEMGAFWSGEFKAGGVPHRLVVAGASRVLRQRAPAGRHAQDLRGRRSASGTTASAPPHKSYLFLLNVVDDGYGGLEHRNSTALIASRRDLPRAGRGAHDATAT